MGLEGGEAEANMISAGRGTQNASSSGNFRCLNPDQYLIKTVNWQPKKRDET